jgi:alkanesulfonate monooxygenase SsuD/methylene tetrahydromethanopterin reductase-like flavin-dependent oxidoreductase (luciferase family)
VGAVSRQGRNSTATVGVWCHRTARQLQGLWFATFDQEAPPLHKPSVPPTRLVRPKPGQKPHPPIHVGGAFPYGARRAIRYGDGWIPTARGPSRSAGSARFRL